MVSTATLQGWGTLTNGELLTQAEAAGFDILLITDKHLAHRQNLSGRRIAIIVLGTSQWPALQSHVHLVMNAKAAAIPGSFTVIEIPH